MQRAGSEPCVEHAHEQTVSIRGSRGQLTQEASRGGRTELPRGAYRATALAQALDVLGERWTLLLIRELMQGSARFSDIQKSIPKMSRSVLAQRLRSLSDSGIIERANGKYCLTEAGREVQPIVIECRNWGVRWITRKLKTAAQVDVDIVVREMRRRLHISTPAPSVVVEMEIRGTPQGITRFYLHLYSDDVEVTLSKPRDRVDLRINATQRAMTEIWLGHAPFEAAIRAGDLTLQGAPELVRWLRLAPAAYEPQQSDTRDSPATRRSGSDDLR